MAKRRKAKGERAAYGGGSIYENRDGTFTVQVYLHKRLVRRRAPNREAAEAILADLNRQKAAGVNIRDGAQSVESFTAYWFPEVYLQREIKPRTAQHTLDMLQWYILPIIGTHSLNAVTHADLQTLLNNMRRRSRGLAPLSAQTVQHVRRVLKDVFSKAKQMKLIGDDPSDGLEAPKVRRTQKPALTPTQMRTVLTIADETRYATIYALMATFGLRVGEALAVQRTDFNQDFSEVTIRRAISYRDNTMGTTKNDAELILPVPPRLQAMCRAQWERVKQLAADEAPGWNARGLLCPSEAGTPIQPRNFERAWSGQIKGERFYPGIKQHAGIPAATLHDFRRFVATTLEDLDVGQRTIGHILGHGAKNVTERYIRRNLPTMRRALEKLEGVLWENDALDNAVSG